MTHFRPCRSATDAKWVADALRPKFGADVFVPDGYAAYRRVYHPFSSAQGKRSFAQTLSQLGTLELFEKAPRPDQLDAEMLARVEIDTPHTGELPIDIGADLATILEPFTDSDEWYYAFWEGVAGLDEGGAKWIYIPARRWVLFMGNADSAGHYLDENETIPTIRPHLWWPADRSWLVSTEVDNGCTDVGCSTEAADALDHSLLEVVPLPKESYS